jgi:mRNA-degrading endonuclease RelE of RelBE toxin-antitoxin system
MAFEIEFSADAERHLKQFTARERKVVLDAVEQQLEHQPTVPTRNRKLLRSHPLATWELRVQDFRVFYNVEEARVVVVVVAVGVKEGNRLLIDGEEFQS